MTAVKLFGSSPLAMNFIHLFQKIKKKSLATFGQAA